MTAEKELFIKAFLEADLIETEKYFDKDSFPFDFSEAFERKMNKLINKDKRISFASRKKLSRALIAAIISLIILLTGLMSVSASREKIVEFIERVFSTNTQITLSENSAPTPETIETAYTLGYVPEGFELKQYESDELGVFAIWENEKGEEIVFTQDILNSDISIDNEHYYEKTEVNGFPGYIHGSGINTLLAWTNNKYWFEISVPDKINNELVDIAKNISEKI